jgi:Ca2+-binding RTX toxin-like protein
MAFIRGTSRPDRLNGTEDSDFIFGFAGDDVVFAFAGNDYVDGSRGDDHVDGGDGDDTLIGGLGNDALEGGRGNDVLVDSFIFAGLQPDSDSRIRDDDIMNGGDGDDVLISAMGNDLIDGGDGNDAFLISGPGLKVVIGGAGDDTAIIGVEFHEPGEPSEPPPSVTPPSILFDGGDGNDTLVVRGLFAGDLTFIGGAGDDTMIFEVHPLFDTLGLLEPGEPLVLGGDGNDTLVASGLFAGNLTFIGGAGDDDARLDELTWLTPSSDFAAGALLDGGAGLDILTGGSGNDTIDGGLDADTLTGGPGEDKFVFGSPGDGVDVITDLTPGVDQVWVDASNFGGGLLPGALAADQFVAGSDPVAVSGTGVFLYDTDDGALAWDADGEGGNAPVTIAVLLNQPALSASDFVIF